MSKVIVITGAGSGFGALSARRLASAGYTVYAGIRETTGRNADRVRDAKDYANQNGVDLRTVELDIYPRSPATAASPASSRKAGASMSCCTTPVTWFSAHSRPTRPKN